MIEIKAITTHYKGYSFRSRLEARWAIYFDTIGLDWEYEVEGFQLGENLRYLPDFWLPQVNCWAEVKPKISSGLSKLEMDKVKALVKQTNHSCILLVGTPDIISYEMICPDKLEERGYDCVLSNNHNYPKTENRFYCCTANGLGKFPEDILEENNSDVAVAVQAARSERFESQTPISKMYSRFK